MKGQCCIGGENSREADFSGVKLGDVKSWLEVFFLEPGCPTNAYCYRLSLNWWSD